LEVLSLQRVVSIKGEDGDQELQGVSQPEVEG
jgi:hypothetical protein